MEIRPFRGFRFRAPAGSDISEFVAPPYDILSAQARDALLARCADNVVAVDLPHMPPNEVGTDAEYAAAAAKLRQWIDSGRLCRDDKPSVYAYQQEFEYAGQKLCRRSLLCSVRLQPFGQEVLPHEHTFAGPKADRLKLTQHAKMQLSPIFGFFRDKDSRVMQRLWDATRKRSPNVVGTLAGVKETIYAVKDEHVIHDLKQWLAGEPIFIADGHHRYTTALNYRDALLREGKIDLTHPANYVLFALVERNDPGMLILPTHRILRGLKADFSVAKLVGSASEFSWRKMPMERLDFRDGDSLKKLGPHAFAILDAKSGELWIAKLEDPQAMKDAAPDQADAWRELDVAILHKLLIEKALAPWTKKDLAIEYTHDGQAVLAACGGGKGQLGIMLAGTPIEAIEAIARAGAAMPHKSTYFYPKLTTGLVFMPLE